jgi:PAS domain S-box-containing protein
MNAQSEQYPLDDSYLATHQPGSESLAATLKQVSDEINQLEEVFRRQREVLKKNGMSLPPGTLVGLQTIHADLAGLSQQIDNARIELAQLRALNRTAQLINSELTLDAVLNGVVQSVIQLTKAERGYLVLRDPVSGELQFKVARTINGTIQNEEFIISSSIVQEVARTGIPVVTSNAENDRRYEGAQSVIGFALRSILCVPLTLRGEVTGVIYADNRIYAGIFGDKERELLFAFANQAAVAIENARLFERAQANLAEMLAVKNLMDDTFASVGSAIITTDAQDRITTLNDAAQAILGLNREEHLGRSLWEVGLPLTRDFDQRVRNSLLNNAEETLEFTTQLPSHATPATLTVRLTPLKDAVQQTQGVAIVIDDVTEIRARSAQIEAIRPYLPPALVENIHDIDQLALGGERLTTTLMYIDVRPFNTFPSDLSPQELVTLLNQYLTIASDEVTLQNGIVDKYISNEVMAIFNTQLLRAERDHAYRAVMAALGMARAYTAFYQKTGEPPHLRHYRIGIHTGIATLGNAGSKTRKEFTALGDTVNLSHRLLENAQPGQILISRETYEACQHALASYPGLRVLERGQLSVKGRIQPVMAYEVYLTP